MKTIELIGEIDAQHHLRADAPEQLPAGQVRLLVFMPDEDDAGTAWSAGVARAWGDDLGDYRQDIYTLEDGQPVDASR